MAEVPERVEWNKGQFSNALSDAASGVIHAPGVQLSADRLARLLDAVPRDPDSPQSPHIKSADFRHATLEGSAFAKAIFSDRADFTGVQFSGATSFYAAQFLGPASFERAHFGGQAEFGAVRFVDTASFHGTRFSGAAGFGMTEFVGKANFLQANFSQDAGFGGAQFAGPSRFDMVRFAVGASFYVARFSEIGTFYRAQFGAFPGDAGFARAHFSRDAVFRESVFRERVVLGPFVVAGTLHLDGVDFEQDLDLDVSASAVSCRRTRFGGRANLNLRWPRSPSMTLLSFRDRV